MFTLCGFEGELKQNKRRSGLTQLYLRYLMNRFAKSGKALPISTTNSQSIEPAPERIPATIRRRKVMSEEFGSQ